MTSQISALNAKPSLDMRQTAFWTVAGGIWLLPLLWIDPTTYLVLTVAGIAMGMLLFLTAVGLTIIFGLMDVLNLAHGAFFAWGAYVGFTVLGGLNSLGWVETGTLGQSVLSVLISLGVALVVGGLWGLVLERLIIKKIYGDHLKQILITVGAAMIMAEIIKVLWGPNQEVMPVPAAFVGSYDIADVVINKFRVAAIAVGAVVYAGVMAVLLKTKLGIIIRAGVENREVVQTLGYNINRIFTGVFAAGAALAAVGGSMWGIFREEINPAMGEENLIFALIVVIIGGLGSVTGSFLSAMMVGLAFNYVAFLMPKLSLGVNILIMAIILLIRPWGLLGKE
ncbi:branched-chain amino acid ABC transporter permease [Desulfoferula mesophila]|uniref:Branched-chain amino acid ABC transporter permease n=1 Tax=Desulfoferula mesophila TaxID=3058419 RepID=A0AAU9EC51_9BACT|nr:branched-chain amino acid ABC transporter permease [Desulfoferula mesophilus]